MMIVDNWDSDPWETETIRGELKYIRTILDDPLTDREVRQADAIRQFASQVALLVASISPLGAMTSGGIGAVRTYFAITAFAGQITNLIVKLTAVVDAFGNQAMTSDQMKAIDEAVSKAANTLTAMISAVMKEFVGEIVSDETFKALNDVVEKVADFKATVDDKSSTSLQRAEAFRALVEAWEKLVDAIVKDITMDRSRERTERSASEAALDRMEHRERMRDIDGGMETVEA